MRGPQGRWKEHRKGQRSEETTKGYKAKENGKNTRSIKDINIFTALPL